MARRVFISVAEVSGDQHASRLISSMRELDPTVVVEGHGGPHMEATGAIIHHETTNRAAMGPNALSRLGEMWRLLRWTRRYFDRNKPDLLICVDSPEMNFHFAKIAHERGVPVLYYIAPQVWAWREGRVAKLRRWVDHVACILPFEEEYFGKHGVKATFVGHPLFDQLTHREPPAQLRFPHRPPVLGLLPGSRRSEALGNYPRLLEAAERIRGAFADVTFLVPTTPATHPVVEKMTRGKKGIEFALNRFDEMVPRCDLCLTVSGTATLHVAGHGVPMIVVYHASRFLWNVIGRWVIKTRTFSLVNLLSPHREHIVPEFVPWSGSSRPVADLAIEFLRDPAKLRLQQDRLESMVSSLDHPGASMNVAKIAVEMLVEGGVVAAGVSV